MSKLITIVGASGVGKTTLANILHKNHGFLIASESHQERPFQVLFKNDPQYALPNQLDYLILRAEHEVILRKENKPGILDGGLDLDFHGFTRLFRTRGWLSENDFDLCRRFYEFARSFLSPPELIIHLQADEKTIRERLAARNRINIASEKDAALLNQYIEEWLKSTKQSQILKINVSSEEKDYRASIAQILKFVTTSS